MSNDKDNETALVVNTTKKQFPKYTQEQLEAMAKKRAEFEAKRLEWEDISKLKLAITKFIEGTDTHYIRLDNAWNAAHSAMIALRSSGQADSPEVEEAHQNIHTLWQNKRSYLREKEGEIFSIYCEALSQDFHMHPSQIWSLLMIFSKEGVIKIDPKKDYEKICADFERILKLKAFL